MLTVALKNKNLLTGILYRATALRLLRQGRAGEKGLLEAGEGGKVVGAAEEALALTVSFFPPEISCNCFFSLVVGAAKDALQRFFFFLVTQKKLSSLVVGAA